MKTLSRGQAWIVAIGLGLSIFSLSACTGGGAAKTDAKAGESKSAAAPSVATSLQHDAFFYYGLSDTSPQRYSFVKFEGAAAEYGTQQARLENATDAEAKFAIDRTGALLQQLGTETVALRPDGVYLVSTTLGTLEKEALLMPAKLEVGTSWTTEHTIDNAQGKVDIKGDFKVEAAEKVTTEAGEFDTLRIASTTTLGIGGKTTTAKSTSWYAKGVGTVKLELDGKDQNGQAIKVRIELVKPELPSDPPAEGATP